MAATDAWVTALAARLRKAGTRPMIRYPTPMELTYPEQPPRQYVSDNEVVTATAQSLGNQPTTEIQRNMQGWWLYRNSLERQKAAEVEKLMRNPVSAFRLRMDARMGRLRDLTLGRQAAELAALYQNLRSRQGG